MAAATAMVTKGARRRAPQTTWNDETRRRVEMADIAGWEITEPEGGVVQPGHRIQVVDMIDPYRPDRLCRYRPLPGNKYVLLTVSVTNSGVMPVVASFSDFSLETDRGRKYNPIVMPDMEDDFGAARCPSPGQTETGSLLFEIPLIALPVGLLEAVSGEENRLGLPASDGQAIVA
ncbi:MAG: DUF4352 domain-containing protein [Gaiellales bacterium]|nr:MAG: DUF4352 domain-containing protein [Gaiellales bacterium]